MRLRVLLNWFHRAALLMMLAAIVVPGSPVTAIAQQSLQPPPRDTLQPPLDTLELLPRDTLGFTLGLSQQRSRLLVASGKTYNRVEGLPVHVGPVFSTVVGNVLLNTEVFGIIRSADTFSRDSYGLGHVVTAGARSTRARGAELKLASYDVVGAVEDWQLPRGEVGLAAFFFHRDYRDYFGRHGVSVTASLFSGARASLDVGFARERWSSLEVRNVLTLLRNNHGWRPNPEVDDGRARLLTARWLVDTRNDERSPSTGWLSRLEYEYGDTEFDQLGATSAGVREAAKLATHYGRLLLDLRRYNRISPESQLNLRLVAGGWLHGGELPLQRRFSVGGPATIPGVRFRDTSFEPDVYTCSTNEGPQGTPAQCERVILLQAEYREELPFRPGTIFGGTPMRIRSAALTLRPVLVAFIDAGRGWLLPDPVFTGTMEEPLVADRSPLLNVVPAPISVPGLAYAKRGFPPLNSFSTDVGVGVDLGLLGAYVAMSLSERGAPVNLIIRARSRF